MKWLMGGAQQGHAVLQKCLGSLCPCALLSLRLTEELRQGFITGFLRIPGVGLAFPGPFEGMVEHTDQVVMLVAGGWNVLVLHDLLLPLALQVRSEREARALQTNRSRTISILCLSHDSLTLQKTRSHMHHKEVNRVFISFQPGRHILRFGTHPATWSDHYRDACRRRGLGLVVVLPAVPLAIQCTGG